MSVTDDKIQDDEKRVKLMALTHRIETARFAKERATRDLDQALKEMRELLWVRRDS